MKFKDHLIYFVKRTKLLIHRVDWANVSPYTYARYILMIVSALNLVAKAFGYDVINVDENELVDKITYILPVIILIVNTYKDNPTSKEAIEYHNKMVEEKAINKQNELNKIQSDYTMSNNTSDHDD